MATRLATATALLSVACTAVATAAPLSSPMIDRGIYREGAVVRSTHRFGTWTLICDDVGGLKQRFCSLRATLAFATGLSATVDVSTGDDGRPAALLHLPLAVSLAYGVKATVGGVGPKARAAAKPRDARTIPIALCDGRECVAAWSLERSELDALNKGRGLSFAICTATPGAAEFATDLQARSCGAAHAAVLTSAGFAEAVRASTQ